MRPIGFADLEVTLRVLLAAPEDARASLLVDIIARAHQADLHRKTYQLPHPQFGTGTLMSATQDYETAPRPGALQAEELAALSIVVETLLVHQRHQIA